MQFKTAASKNLLLAWAHQYTKAEKLLLYNHQEMEKLLFWSETSKILIYLEDIGWVFQQSEKKLDGHIPLNFNSI